MSNIAHDSTAVPSQYIYKMLCDKRSYYIRDVINAKGEYERIKAEQRAWDDENRDNIGPGFNRPRITYQEDAVKRTEAELSAFMEIFDWYVREFMK